MRKGRSESIVESKKTSPDVQQWERGRRGNRTAWGASRRDEDGIL